MFYVKDPESLDRPWVLSKSDDVKKVVLPLDVTKCLKNYHLMGIEFLYHNYRKGLQGSILNETEGMNYQLQVSAFLRAVVEDITCFVLVICPAISLGYWHYHLTNHAGFEVFKLDAENIKVTFPSNKVALLLEQRDLRMSEELNIDFFTIIVDNFDQLANKLLVKRLQSRFNIGITSRNFYLEPDQKLVWNMLNWANPGCVGKQSSFYKVDNRNLDNFRNSYRFWWFRLTWNFCESFQHPSPEESSNYDQIIIDWSERFSLQHSQSDKSISATRKNGNKKRSKRNVSSKGKKRERSEKVESNQETQLEIDEKSDKLKINDPKETSPEKSKRRRLVSDKQCIKAEPVPLGKYVKLPSMDENPIVNSIKEIMNSSVPFSTRHCHTFAGPSTSHSPCASEEFIVNLISSGNETIVRSYSEEDIHKLLKFDTKLED